MNSIAWQAAGWNIDTTTGQLTDAERIDFCSGYTTATAAICKLRVTIWH